MTPEEFHELCSQHDWQYEFTDDHSVWLEGLRQRKRLTQEMQHDLRLSSIYISWTRYAYGNSPRPEVQK